MVDVCRHPFSLLKPARHRKLGPSDGYVYTTGILAFALFQHFPKGTLPPQKHRYKFSCWIVWCCMENLYRTIHFSFFQHSWKILKVFRFKVACFELVLNGNQLFLMLRFGLTCFFVLLFNPESNLNNPGECSNVRSQCSRRWPASYDGECPNRSTKTRPHVRG